jgi:hypothetical protein
VKERAIKNEKMKPGFPFFNRGLELGLTMSHRKQPKAFFSLLTFSSRSRVYINSVKRHPLLPSTSSISQHKIPSTFINTIRFKSDSTFADGREIGNHSDGKRGLKYLLKLYGPIAFIAYSLVSACSITIWYLAISLGVDVEPFLKECLSIMKRIQSRLNSYTDYWDARKNNLLKVMEGHLETFDQALESHYSLFSNTRN